MPCASFRTTANCVDCPMVSVVDGAETVTEATGATGGGLTVTDALPETPSTVATIAAVPAATAVTRPVDDTVALVDGEGGLLVTLSLAFTLGALEIGLRVSGSKPQTATMLGTFYDYDPLLKWRGKPDVVCRFATTDFDVVIEHGSDGFRRPRPEAEVRTSAISVTAGNGFGFGGFFPFVWLSASGVY